MATSLQSNASPSFKTATRTTIRQLSHSIAPFDYTVLAICMVLVPSGVIHGLVGIDQKFFFAALAPIVAIGVLIRRRSKFTDAIPLLFLMFTIVGALASIVAQSESQMLMGVTLSIAIVAGHQLFTTLKNEAALRVASWFTLILLAGGIIGLVYSIGGGQPLLEVPVEYRTTYLYLTTFSFALIGDIIRPSGIFDEPGAFAMYVAIVTMFNDVLQKNRFINIALIVFLVFTGSLAGLFLALLYVFFSNSVQVSRLKIMGLITVSLGVFAFVIYAFPNNVFSSALNTFFGERLQIVDGRLVGDNRSNQITDFFALVDDEMLLRGQKASHREYYEEDQSSNPFSIIFGYGLVISLPYFALLLWLIIVTLKNGFRNSYTSLGLLILLLQRPYIYHLSWSIVIASVVWLLYISTHRRYSGG